MSLCNNGADYKTAHFLHLHIAHRKEVHLTHIEALALAQLVKRLCGE
nr:hypothetical protein [Photorhabdus khanii]